MNSQDHADSEYVSRVAAEFIGNKHTHAQTNIQTLNFILVGYGLDLLKLGTVKSYP